MATFPVYIDVPAYLNNAANSVETGSLVGMQTILTGGPYAAGVSTLNVVSAAGTTTTPSSTSPVEAWILDGLNSEIVEITGIAANTLTLQSPTLAAHANGVSISTAGSLGSLADIITQASREADNICNQGASGALDRSLYAISRTEVYSLATTRATVDALGTLQIWPFHFPVQTLTSVTLQIGTVAGNTVDLSAVTLPEGARSIAVPSVGFSAPSSLSGWSWYSPVALRAPNRWVTLVYTAGPITGSTLASVPADIQRACMELTNDILAERKNPVGAATIKRGDEMYTFELRGDVSGNSMLFKKAQKRLRTWTRHI